MAGRAAPAASPLVSSRVPLVLRSHGAAFLVSTAAIGGTALLASLQVSGIPVLLAAVMFSSWEGGLCAGLFASSLP